MRRNHAERSRLSDCGRVIAVAIASDIYLNHGTIALFLVRKIIRLVEYLEFWR